MVVACTWVMVMEVGRGGGSQRYFGGLVGLICDGLDVGGGERRGSDKNKLIK